MASAAATRKSEVPAERLAELNAGRAEAATLAEALVVDHAALLRSAVPDASSELLLRAEQARELGILKRMDAIGSALFASLPAGRLSELARHPSDTVRGWVCFAHARNPDLSLPALLETSKPLADDCRFTVREWAWMALRPRLVEQLERAIELLVPWTAETSENLRRFAGESLRPRGVWASHIAELKNAPSLGEPLLEPLRADPSRYVQDSVANWINDASKSSPEWARAICGRWSAESPEPATAYIVRRALRSLS